MRGFEERETWTERLDGMRLKEPTLIPGNCLLCAAFLVYVAPFPHRLRSHIMNDIWLEDLETRTVPHQSPFDVKTFFATHSQINR